jgi:hypothetical protein
MKNYNNLVDALKDLKARGFNLDFNLKPDCIECTANQLRLHPEDFEIKETYRLEEGSSPDGNSIIYAIEANTGAKGVLVDAYSIYGEALNPAMILKLQ